MTWIPSRIEEFLLEPMAGNFLSKHVDSAMSQNCLKTSSFSFNEYLMYTRKRVRSYVCIKTGMYLKANKFGILKPSMLNGIGNIDNLTNWVESCC